MNVAIVSISSAVLAVGLYCGLMGAASVPTATANTMMDRSSFSATTGIKMIPLTQLPPEAKTTLGLIQRGGPFPYPQKDGTVFGNFEKRLPVAARGYYREYTVPTPGARNRGARRIIASQRREYYYTGDHYATFAKIQLPIPKR
ncbi:MAG: guanyl-specific ribonuclease Sa [Alkalinema sp. CAN_BIN05]|nr:guanyl-specific ribonuclease Sa [Alkalinema sp. CAN_BIN05]